MKLFWEGFRVIRAGRRGRVQSVAGLAQALGVSVGTLRNNRPYAASGFPDPVSSPRAQTLLWDEEQTAAYFAGEPVPALPAGEDDEDLLDRHEAAHELNVGVSAWNTYKRDPAVAEHLVVVAGVEHWPRGAVRRFRDSRPGRGVRHGSGRPRGSGDMVPRDQVLLRTQGLLDADPTLTAAAVVEELGVAMTTAMKSLATLRGRRIADLLEHEPHLDPQLAAERLGYPQIARRRALAAAKVEMRMREVRPYLQAVVDVLAENGFAEAAEVEVVELEGGALAAAVQLAPGRSAVPALVWDERYGWRTATSRRHPIGKDIDARPTGEGVHYLAPGLRPEPARVPGLLRSLGF
ncbi:DUF6292 family protein [Streptomyces sp. NPDC056387]|uniref:DUF6292 family protein n=1 Tax=Streptomyces sp. NPDC056387 TaxID=3345803 RepID=UPI0035D6682D